MKIFGCFMVDFNQPIQLTLADNKNFVMCGLRAYMNLVGLLKLSEKEIDENWCCGNLFYFSNFKCAMWGCCLGRLLRLYDGMWRLFWEKWETFEKFRNWWEYLKERFKNLRKFLNKNFSTQRKFNFQRNIACKFFSTHIRIYDVNLCETK